MVDEDDETFTLTLSAPSQNAELGSDASATGTIIDDDQVELIDATIKGLTLTDPNGASIVLTPPFHLLVDTYEASVPNDVATISVAATKNYGGAILEFIDGVGAIQTGGTLEIDYSLDVGDNLVQVEVTLASGNEVKTYTVTVTREASDDATLSSFELLDANGTISELTPEFDPATTVYSVSVPNGVESVTLTTAKSHAGASVVILSPSGASEPDGATVALAVGGNLIEAMVTAEDGNTVVIYMLSVERAEPEWSATLTVGTDETLVPIATGYSRWSMTGTDLSASEFTFDGITYGVMLLFNLSEGLYFRLDKELPSDFTLRIGGYEYAGRDSSIARSRWKGNYWWGDRGFSWTPGQTVEVSLSMYRATLPNLQDAPPVAYFTYAPSGHNGDDSFQFRLNFTQPVDISEASLRDHALVVDGGSVSKVEVLKGRRWLVTVVPDSSDDVIVSLYEAASCQELGAICSGDGKSLYYYPTLTVPGPGAIATPAQPQGLTAVAVHDDSVSLTWDDPGDASIIGYQVLRGPEADNLAVIAEDTRNADGEYVDETVEPETEYVYVVKAINGGGVSAQSSPVTVTTLLDPRTETCSGGGYDQVPVEVEVAAVPIVVESTTADYFVLYVQHGLDADTAVDIPVSVALGEAGTTTLAENIEALPKERYRVEKYLVADPADVDGDCIDDITELADSVGMNPINPAAAIDVNDGALSIPDSATFRKLSYLRAGTHVKFILIGLVLQSRMR